MEDFELKARIEALLVAADRWAPVADLARVLGLTAEEGEAALREYEDELLDSARGIELRRRGQAVRIEIKAPYVSLIGELFPERRNKPLSDQANEVLAVIAHTQPVSTRGVSEIRGIESASVIENLAERGLVRRLRQRGPSRERLWKVSQRFLDLHNLASVEEIFQEEVVERVFPGITARARQGSAASA